MTRTLTVLALIAGGLTVVATHKPTPRPAMSPRLVAAPDVIPTPTRRATRSLPRRTLAPVIPIRPDFAALAQCESSGNPRAVSPGGKYRGLYQFDARTWRSVGGVGDPAAATPAEQTKRARLLYLDRGRQPWPECGRWL